MWKFGDLGKIYINFPLYAVDIFSLPKIITITRIEALRVRWAPPKKAPFLKTGDEREGITICLAVAHYTKENSRNGSFGPKNGLNLGFLGASSAELSGGGGLMIMRIFTVKSIISTPSPSSLGAWFWASVCTIWIRVHRLFSIPVAETNCCFVNCIITTILCSFSVFCTNFPHFTFLSSGNKMHSLERRINVLCKFEVWSFS